MLSRQTLSNGAILEPISSEKCDVCARKNEVPDAPQYTLTWKGKKLYLCPAHAVAIMYMDEDEQYRKEGIESLFKGWEKISEAEKERGEEE